MESSDIESGGQEAQPGEQGLSWWELLQAYRLEPSEESSAALLERLGPWLTNARKALLDSPPLADGEDVAQQLIVEVLDKAARWQPRCEDRWIPRKLVEEAERRVRNALRRERGHERLELDEQFPAPQSEEPLVLETPIGRASADDLRVLFRYHVLGEPLAQMASRAGITPRQMRRRIQHAKERARA